MSATFNDIYTVPGDVTNIGLIRKTVKQRVTYGIPYINLAPFIHKLNQIVLTAKLC